MSAVTIRLEQQAEVAPIQSVHAECVSDLSAQPGVGHLHQGPQGQPVACPAPSQVLAEAHQGLLQLSWARYAVEQLLAGRSFTVQNGTWDGKDLKTVYIVLDEPIGPGPPWHPTTDPRIRQVRALSWTSKMNTPSWSLPAGAPHIGGACPGAAGGQSVVPKKAFEAGAKHVLRVIGQPVRVDSSICENCYATGGQYSTSNVQVAQVLRFMWAKQALKQVNPDSGRSMFVDTMIAAITNANFRLEGGHSDPDDESGHEPEVDESLPPGAMQPTLNGPEAKKKKPPLPPERTGQRFFRIHDSGDFFDERYLAAWKEICDALPDITFWAPSRIWATSWGVDAVNRLNFPPKNLVIRPSAYHVGEIAPADLGPGWAGGSVVIQKKMNLGMTPEREEMVRRVEGRLGIKPDVRAPGGPDPRYSWD